MTIKEEWDVEAVTSFWQLVYYCPICGALEALDPKHPTSSCEGVQFNIDLPDPKQVYREITFETGDGKSDG